MSRQQRRFARERALFGLPPMPTLISSKLFNRELRTHCTQCGAGHLTWIEADDVATIFDGEQLAELQHMISYVGSDGEIWLCMDCEHVGVLSGWGS